MSTVDDKLAAWRRVTEKTEPSPELLAGLSAAAAGAELRQVVDRVKVNGNPSALALRPAAAPAARKSPPRPLSAADRARIRRHAGRLAGWKMFWAERPGAQRFATAAAVLLCVVALGGGWAKLNGSFDRPVPVAPEIHELVPGQPVEQSFGWGEGVNYPRIDQKVFDFVYKAPVKMVVVLHFQARDISANEVVVSVNGTDIGFVPPDTLAVNERMNEALIPPSALIRNGRNLIIFDNVHNPPDQQSWRIWNIWVEVFPLPELSREELIVSAQEDLRRGQDFWDRRQVGAENLYKAWSSFREAWLLLESLDPIEPIGPVGPAGSVDRSRPMEYLIARDKMREAQMSLDRLCSQLLLEAQSAYNAKRYDDARSTLEHVNEYFPKHNHVCPFRAEQMRDIYEL